METSIISIAIPTYVLKFLKSKARKLSAEQDKDINHADLIRKAVIKQYKIKEENDVRHSKNAKQRSKSKTISK